MSMLIVFQQMVLIFILMMMGYVLAKKNILSVDGTQQLSWIVVNICNPALVVYSAFDENATATNREVLFMILIAGISFLVLIIIGNFMGAILRVPKDERKFYNLLTVFGNTGFIGIPVVSAVVGTGALIYVAVYNMMFNLIVYTYGIVVLTKGEEDIHTGSIWKKIFSWGTISGVLAIVLFMSRVKVPTMVIDLFTYMGRPTTFLSMVVLGASMAKVKWSEIFQGKQNFIFSAIRLLVIPIATAFITKPLIANQEIRMVIVLLTAMPMANMPLMLATQYGMNTTKITRVIVLTTILSLFTITITAAFV
ncbi:MAG: AEC family transporter [Lachnospiraceae bacterium]|jgi:predicted permease|nr:AEC family transporter [Lachnospiraceae bacterium]MDD3616473.1 AEC family transporter [Lachnospiraceae bacterium]